MAWIKVDQNIPGEGFSLKSTWDVADGVAWDTSAAYVNILSHWPLACQRRWAEFDFTGKPAVVGDCRRWKYFMWTSSADATCSSETITGGLVENCGHSICIFRKFEYVGDPSQMRRGPTGTDHQTFPVAARDYVAGRSAQYENQALYIWAI